MLKNILKLDGAQELAKNTQKNINGGGAPEYCMFSAVINGQIVTVCALCGTTPVFPDPNNEI